MIKVLIVCLLLWVPGASCAQQTEPSDTLPPVTAADLLRKSKGQRTAAIVLTVAGGAGLLLTFTADLGQAMAGGLTTVFSLGMVEPEYKSMAVPYLLSAAALGSGIYLFTAAGKNKKKAQSLTAGMRLEKVHLPGKGGMDAMGYPAFSVRVPIR